MEEQTAQAGQSNEMPDIESVIASMEAPQKSSSEQEQPKQEAAPALVDLDSVQKFRVEGKEYSLEDLKKWQQGHMFQSDYTKKTQSLAEERKTFEADRKYYDNLEADLDAVRKNPSLMLEFQKTYPEKFHRFVEFAVTPEQRAKVQGMDPEFLSRFNKLESSWLKREEDLRSQEIDNQSKQLEMIAGTMTKKYPLASENEALAIGEALIAEGKKLDDKVWNDIYKGIHDRVQKQADAYYQGKVKQQTESNKKATDTAKGGGIPGQAPKEFRNIKEATKAFLDQSGS